MIKEKLTSYCNIVFEEELVNEIVNVDAHILADGHDVLAASVLYKHPKALDLYLGVRYMAERPVIEDESVFADSYFLMDASVNYTLKGFQFGLSVQNIFNVRWMEAVFYDASKLKTESEAVDDFHFTPGSPRYIKGSLSYSF